MPVMKGDDVFVQCAHGHDCPAKVTKVGGTNEPHAVSVVVQAISVVVFLEAGVIWMHDVPHDANGTVGSWRTRDEAHQ